MDDELLIAQIQGFDDSDCRSKICKSSKRIFSKSNFRLYRSFRLSPSISLSFSFSRRFSRTSARTCTSAHADPFPSFRSPRLCIIRELPTTTLRASTDSGPRNTRRMANDRTNTGTTTRIHPQWPPLPMQRFILCPLSLPPAASSRFLSDENSTCPGRRIVALRRLHYCSCRQHPAGRRLAEANLEAANALTNRRRKTKT